MERTYTDPDESNAAGMRVRDDGNGCLELALLTFNGVPLSARLTIPKASAIKAVREFFHTLLENEDIYLSLLQEHLNEHMPKTVPEKKKPSLRDKVLRRK